MSDIEIIKTKYDRKKIIQLLMNTTQKLDTYSRATRKEAEEIKLSCRTPGTKGSLYQCMLKTRANGMMRLAELYLSAAKRYKNAATNLTDGSTVDEVLPEVVAYSIFFNDQVETEQEGFKQILSILRSDNINL